MHIRPGITERRHPRPHRATAWHARFFSPRDLNTLAAHQRLSAQQMSPFSSMFGAHICVIFCRFFSVHLFPQFDAQKFSFCRNVIFCNVSDVTKYYVSAKTKLQKLNKFVSVFIFNKLNSFSLIIILLVRIIDPRLLFLQTK